MSTNYTQNYKLCQWEASDKVRRVDFNEDNAKIETALTRIERTANHADTAASEAYSPQNPSFMMGTYQGKMRYNENGSQKITLGFRPKAVLVFPQNGGVVYSEGGTMFAYGGLALDGQKSGFLEIDATGFTASNANLGKLADVIYSLNDNRYTYFYIALR